MRAVTGVFRSLGDASRAVERLHRTIERDRINLLTPGSTEEEIHHVPTTEDMPPVGGAMGAVLGTALGAGIGLKLPAVGVVTAVGAAAAAALGVAGGVAGWKAGDAVDRKSSTGLPIDELYVYEDALEKGHTVVIAMVHKDEEHDVRAILRETGAESIDEAREHFWDGLRDAEEREYEGDFSADEDAYRRGFEAAHLPPHRRRPLDEVEPALRERHGELVEHGAFRRGYERGLARMRRRLGP